MKNEYFLTPKHWTLILIAGISISITSCSYITNQIVGDWQSEDGFSLKITKEESIVVGRNVFQGGTKFWRSCLINPPESYTRSSNPIDNMWSGFLKQYERHNFVWRIVNLEGKSGDYLEVYPSDEIGTISDVNMWGSMHHHKIISLNGNKLILEYSNRNLEFRRVK